MELREELQHTLGSTYTLERELRRGGMARVFVATETRLRRSVVVKVLSPDLAADVSAERFEREIQFAASLQQANIVPVLSAGDMDGVPYYTMPYVEGESLRTLLATRGELPISEVVSILRDVARALSYAHAHGVVHRDIKPDNVLLSHGAAVVTDFGIAKAISASRTAPGDPTLTQAGAPIGTPAYMSPEQVAGDPSIDQRADVYAFGCVAYELLTGNPPFTEPSPQRVLVAHLTETPKPVRELRPETPTSLASLVMRCLEKHPGDRPASADEMTQTLDAVAAPRVADGTGALSRAATRQGWQLTIALLGFVAIVFGVFTLWRGRSGPGVGAVDKSVAVLPLANLSGDKANDYFGEGLAEEITDKLTQAGVRVIGRSGAGELARKGLDASEIVKQLRVAYMVQGSVQPAGDSVRVRVSLTSTRDGGTLWVHAYYKQLKDVFAVQDSIARSVASELQVTLAGGSRAILAHRETNDPEAHVLYYQGMQLWNRRTGTALQQAISYFQRAIKRDPRYARAYAGLALSYALLPDYADVDTKEAAGKAIAAARQSLALDSTLADAYAAIGSGESRVWRNASADSALRHAIALDSSFATAHHWYAILLCHLGQFDPAIREIERARELEPASLIINSNVGAILSLAGRTTEAEAILRESLELDSTFAETRNKLGIVLLYRGMLRQAVVEFERALALHGRRSPNIVAALAQTYARSGRTEDARRLLSELTTRSASEHVSASAVALVYSDLGEHDKALEWLQRGVDGFDPLLQFFNRDRRFDRLRADPRGKALFARIETMQ
jgi:TolB-like protein/Flp pilus assembly protein TadD